MAGEHHGGTAAGVALEQGPDRPRRHRVDRLEGLVQEQHPGGVEQGGGQSDLLAHPVAVVGHQRPGRLGQAEHVEQLPGTLGHGGRGHAAQQAVVGEQFVAGEPVEQAQVLGEDADALLGRERVVPDLDAVHRHPPGVWSQQPSHHAQRRGLPGPVRPDQAEEAAVRNVQVDPVHGHLAVERLAQAPYGERGVRRARRAVDPPETVAVHRAPRHLPLPGWAIAAASKTRPASFFGVARSRAMNF